MFNLDTHKAVMVRILRDIYGEVDLRKILGFKGGTMAMLFYGLPRMSADLDFDLLDEGKKAKVFEKLGKILSKYGKILEKAEKKFTLFYLLDYGFEERKLKIEISKRPTEMKFEARDFMGISMMIMTKEAMVACKMAAMVGRKHEANRDVFDMWYFLKNNFEIDEKVFEEKSELTIGEGWKLMKERVERLKANEVLFGLGDLLDASKKDLVKIKMKEELMLEIKMRAGE